MIKYSEIKAYLISRNKPTEGLHIVICFIMNHRVTVSVTVCVQCDSVYL